MKIALAQINPIIGDFEGNLEKIELSLSKAASLNIDLCVFPEMAVTGYPPQSLLFHNKFVSDNLKYLDQLISKTRETAAIIGYVRPAPNSLDNRLENVAALIAGQEIVSTHAKSRLSVHGACDEHRYFEPAAAVRAIDFNGIKLGICFYDDFCENNNPMQTDRQERDPVCELVAQGAELVIAIGAAAYDYENRSDRLSLLKETAQSHSRPVLYVNQVGGNDEFIFDGGSVVLGADGEVIARAEEFDEDFIVVDIEKGEGDLRSAIPDDDQALIEALVLGTKDYTKKSGFKTTAIDLSADLESSVVATIAARAVGGDNVYGVIMPSRMSAGSMVDDALALATNLRIHAQIIEIDTLFETYLSSIKPALCDLSSSRLESSTEIRIKAMTLMSIANAFGHLVLSSFNRSQLYIGQTTLSGNMAGGLSVISDVSKTLVERVAGSINKNSKIIPQSIVDRCANASAQSVNVHGSAPTPYTLVDSILKRLIDQNLSAQATVAEGFAQEVVMEIAKLMRTNEHKRRQAPPGLKISTKTRLGTDAVPLGHRFNI